MIKSLNALLSIDLRVVRLNNGISWKGPRARPADTGWYETIVAQPVGTWHTLHHRISSEHLLFGMATNGSSVSRDSYREINLCSTLQSFNAVIFVACQLTTKRFCHEQRPFEDSSSRQESQRN